MANSRNSSGVPRSEACAPRSSSIGQRASCCGRAGFCQLCLSCSSLTSACCRKMEPVLRFPLSLCVLCSRLRPAGLQELLLERVRAAAALLSPCLLRLGAEMVEGWKHKLCCLLACFLCMVTHEAHGRNFATVLPAAKSWLCNVQGFSSRESSDCALSSAGTSTRRAPGAGGKRSEPTRVCSPLVVFAAEYSCSSGHAVHQQHRRYVAATS